MKRASPRLASLAGAPDANGVVGDLGGAASSFIELDAIRARARRNLPLGPLVLVNAVDGFDYDRVSRRMHDELAAPRCCAKAAAIFTPSAALGARSGAIDIATARSSARRAASS